MTERDAPRGLQPQPEFTTPVILCLLLLLLAVLGSLGGETLSLERVATGGLITLVIVVGLYIFVGNSGIFSFGHTGFLAIGGYTGGLLTLPASSKEIALPNLPYFLSAAEFAPIPATLAGGAVAAAVALVVGIPLMRLSGIAASIGTFALLVSVYVVASNWNGVTGGLAGMTGVPTTTGIYTALAWALIAVLIAWVFQRSTIAVRLRAAREDETAARSCGIGVFRQRRAALVLSAFVVGIAGAIYVQFVGSFTPQAFYLQITFLTLAMLIVGGVNSLSGAVLGTISMTAVFEVLRSLEDGFAVAGVSLTGRPGIAQMGLALIMLAVLLRRPKGLTGGRELRILTGPAVDRRRSQLHARRTRAPRT